ncbi:MAG TPA: ABC transporter substrate-binding protein [Candidatus Limnocylindrales bacterium]|nr:ABC transporter substrate-binding protein [Candidatus Limnocylindrales bacterium]
MRTFALSLALVVVCAVFGPAAAATEAPEKFVARTSDEVLAILRDKALNHDAKISRLEAMLDERSDFDTISKLVLASHYRQFSDDQKKEFITLLHRYLTTTYGRQIDNYANETVSVTGGRPEARGDYTVQTKIKRTTGADLSVEYRLRKVGEDWRLIDVIGEGISLVSNLRSQFGEILNDGGPDRLIKVLREKNASGTPADLPLSKKS